MIILIIFFIINLSLFTSDDYKIVRELIEHKDSKMNYEVKVSYPKISGMNNDAQKKFNEHAEAFAKSRVDSFKVWMMDWDTTTTNKEFGSFYELGDSVFYRDSKLLSIMFYELSYFSGAAHPNNYNYCINYDLQNNRAIELKDLFTGSYLKKLSDICIKELYKQKKEYIPDFREPDEWILEGAEPKEMNFKVFNITKKYFVITFPTYQAASYAEGPKEVKISYSKLRDVIKSDGLLEDFVE